MPRAAGREKEFRATLARPGANHGHGPPNVWKFSKGVTSYPSTKTTFHLRGMNWGAIGAPADFLRKGRRGEHAQERAAQGGPCSVEGNCLTDK